MIVKFGHDLINHSSTQIIFCQFRDPFVCATASYQINHQNASENNVPRNFLTVFAANPASYASSASPASELFSAAQGNAADAGMFWLPFLFQPLLNASDSDSLSGVFSLFPSSHSVFLLAKWTSTRSPLFVMFHIPWVGHLEM